MFLDCNPKLPKISLLLPPSLSPWGSAVPFYPECFPIEPWDSLSGSVHPWVACLAFQPSDLPGAFQTSLSDYPLLLGVYPNMTFC